MPVSVRLCVRLWGVATVHKRRVACAAIQDENAACSKVPKWTVHGGAHAILTATSPCPVHLLCGSSKFHGCL